MYGMVCYAMLCMLWYVIYAMHAMLCMLWNVMYAMVWLCVLWYAVFSGARTYALAPLGHMPLLRCPALAHSSQSGLKDSSSGFGLGLLIKGSPLLLAACPLPLARSSSFLSFLFWGPRAPPGEVPKGSLEPLGIPRVPRDPGSLERLGISRCPRGIRDP